MIDMLFHFSIRADDRSAFERIEDLRRVETQNRQIAVAQNAAACIFNTGMMSGIVDDLKIAFFRDLRTPLASQGWP